MDNVIGYKGSIEERKINWSILRELKEQLKFYKEHPDKYTIATDKQSKAYKRVFKEYTSIY